MKTCIERLVDQLVTIQTGSPWIGTSYQKKLERISDEDFFRRPLPGMPSVSEIISHLTTWRQETILKMETGAGSITDKHPSNWRDPNELKRMGRDRLMENYEDSLEKIRDLLLHKPDSFLELTYYDTDFKSVCTHSWLLNGMLHHDIYHLGQLGYILKFLEKTN